MSHNQTATAVRDLFFATAIPLKPGATLACLKAGAALASLAAAHGVPERLYRRDEVYWGVVACQLMRAINAEIVGKLETLPASAKRQAAIEKLTAYSKALS